MSGKILKEFKVEAKYFVDQLKVNVDNSKLSDADFRKFVRNTLPIVEGSDDFEDKREIIKSIKEVECVEAECGGYKHSNMAGYEIETNKQTIKILIDNSPDCCEHWGYFSTNDDVKDFIDEELLDITLTNKALNEVKVKENAADSLDCGDIIFVDIKTGFGILQFAVYNAHNGYYGHSVLIQSNQIKHETSI
jgi:hypothetical protein